jgi:hypothetical protein
MSSTLKFPTILFCVAATLIVVFSLVYLPVFCQVPSTGEYSLTVKILEESNRFPVAYANVTVYGPLNQTKYSDLDGLAFFVNLPAGDYRVITTAPDYTVQSSQPVSLTGDTTITLLFSTTKALFIYTPEVLTPKTTVHFDASPSNSSGKITGYSWDFGDNTTTQKGLTVSHIFSKFGEYRVSLTVTSTVGVATYTQTLVVKGGDNNYWLIFILIPFPIFIFLLWRRRRKYYVVIQARAPPHRSCSHCPGDNTECRDCKLTPC